MPFLHRSNQLTCVVITRKYSRRVTVQTHGAIGSLVHHGPEKFVPPHGTVGKPSASCHREASGPSGAGQINFGLFARPESLPGLQIGGSFYHDQISDFQRGPTVRLGQTIVNAHVVYNTRALEFLSEGFLVRHVYEQNGPIYNMPAFYAQLSRKFGHIRPYFRYQYINANRESIFEDVSLRHGPSFGARYDFNANIGFKAQLDHTARKGLPDLNGLQLQLVFAF